MLGTILQLQTATMMHSMQPTVANNPSPMDTHDVSLANREDIGTGDNHPLRKLSVIELEPTDEKGKYKCRCGFSTDDSAYYALHKRHCNPPPANQFYKAADNALNSERYLDRCLQETYVTNEHHEPPAGDMLFSCRCGYSTDNPRLGLLMC